MATAQLFSTALVSAGTIASSILLTNQQGAQKYTFQLTGAFTGVSVALYATIDEQTALGGANNWFLVPAKSAQAGAGVEQNPLFSATQSLEYEGYAVAFQAISLATAPTGAWNALVAGVATSLPPPPALVAEVFYGFYPPVPGNTVRDGTVLYVPADGSSSVQVTFQTPFNYSLNQVELTVLDGTSSVLSAKATNKTNKGFTLTVYGGATGMLCAVDYFTTGT